MNGTNSSIDMDMLMSFLSQGGAAIAGPDSFAAGVNPLVQQTIKAKSFSKMVSQLLKDGGKFNMDKESFNIKAPVSALGSPQEDIGLQGAGGTSGFGGEGITPAPAPAPAPTAGAGAGMDKSALMSLILNPSSSSLDISNASLAGLSADDISKALQIKFAADKMRIAETTAGIPDETALQKNYAAAVAGGFSGSIIDFKNVAMTTHEKDYRSAVEGGYTGTFHEWMRDMASISGTGLGLAEFKKRKEITKEVDRAAFLKTPKFRTDAEKIVDDKWRHVYEGEDDPTKARNKLIWEEMDKQVKTSYPDVTFGEDTKTGIIGWYDKKGNLVASWQ